MVDGLALAISSIKSAGEMAVALIELRDTAIISAKTIELQGKISAAHQLVLAAQQDQSAAIRKIDDLEKRIVQFENWETEKQRYELVKLDPGIFVRRLKLGMENGEPAHEICANCYDAGKKSLLHNLGHANGLTHWKCHSCGFDERSGTFTAPRVNRGGDWRS